MIMKNIGAEPQNPASELKDHVFTGFFKDLNRRNLKIPANELIRTGGKKNATNGLKDRAN